MKLDQLIGSDGAFYRAAFKAATDYLERPPLTSADHVADRVREAIAHEPTMWPDVEKYLERRQASQSHHDINRNLSGIVRTNEAGERMIFVFGHYWKQMCVELRINSAHVCRELDARHILHRTDSSRRTNEWTTKFRLSGVKMYQLQLELDGGES